MDKWEYKVAYLAHRGGDKYFDSKLPKMYWELDLEKKLNELGAQGWEIVCFPADMLSGKPDGYALFKRKIGNN